MVAKNLPATPGDAAYAGSLLGSGRPPGEGNGNPLQCSCLENPRDRGYSPWVHKKLNITEWLSKLHARGVQGNGLICVYGEKWLPQSTHPSSHIATTVLCLLRTLKISFLSKFQVWNTASLSVVVTLYIRSPELIHLITVPLWSISPFFPTPALTNYYFALCFCEFDIFRFHIWVRSYSICLSLSELFHLAECPPGSSMLLQIAGPSFRVSSWLLYFTNVTQIDM